MPITNNFGLDDLDAIAMLDEQQKQDEETEKERQQQEEDNRRRLIAAIGAMQSIV
jgi:hypothetical protein